MYSGYEWHHINAIRTLRRFLEFLSSGFRRRNTPGSINNPTAWYHISSNIVGSRNIQPFRQRTTPVHEVTDQISQATSTLHTNLSQTLVEKDQPLLQFDAKHFRAFFCRWFVRNRLTGRLQHLFCRIASLNLTRVTRILRA